MAAILWKHKPAAGAWKHLQHILQSVLSGYIYNHAEKVCGKEIISFHSCKTNIFHLNL